MDRTLTQKQVPFLRLSAIHRDIKQEVIEAIEGLIETGAFTNGPAVGEFEQAFAAYVGCEFAVGVGSGLDALRLGLLAAGLQPGDEVLVPANTFVATLEAVTQAGGRVVVVDQSEDDWNIDVAKADAAVFGRTRFVIPVHLYGQLADMRALRDLASNRGLTIVEDACQAHGAERDGLRAGAVGKAGAFSFYPGKNLGAFGDAGAVVTGDAALAERVRALREHGQRVKYEHDVEGYTSRLDTIQAIVLLRKLALLDTWNEQRRRIAERYLEDLAGVGDVELPPVAPQSSPVWHLFVIRTGHRDALADFLDRQGIATGRHYPIPVHLTRAYAWLGHKRGDFPHAERHAEQSLSLPIFPGMTVEETDAVIGAVDMFFRRV